MTDMLSTPSELLAKPCDQWCELEIVSAYHAIKKLEADLAAARAVIVLPQLKSCDRCGSNIA